MGMGAIVMRKGNAEICFDITIMTKSAAILATHIKCRNTLELQGGMVVQEGSNMSMEKAHDLFGHSHDNTIRATAEHLG